MSKHDEVGGKVSTNCGVGYKICGYVERKFVTTCKTTQPLYHYATELQYLCVTAGTADRQANSAQMSRNRLSPALRTTDCDRSYVSCPIMLRRCGVCYLSHRTIWSVDGRRAGAATTVCSGVT